PVLENVLSIDDLRELQQQVAQIYVDPTLISWVVDLASATRRPADYGAPGMAPYVSYGASPRGPISVVAAARALALVRGRDYVVVADVEALAREAIRQPLLLSYHAPA